MSLPASFPFSFGDGENSGSRLGVVHPMSLSRKQTGSPGKSDYGRKGGKIRKLLNPWGGPNIPQRSRKAAKPSGSSRRQAKSDSSLSGMSYPRNSPADWPVEPDFVNHVLAPAPSGLDTTATDASNAAVEQAYHRAGYQ